MTASYDGIPPNKTDMASALINAARNTGGSIGVSLASNVLSHREPVSSEPPLRTRRPVEPAVSARAAARDPVFCRARQHAGGGPAARLRLGRRTDADAGGLPRLYRRLLGAHDHLPGADSARAHAAQGQARRRNGHGALTPLGIGRRRRYADGLDRGARNAHRRTHINVCVSAGFDGVGVEILRPCDPMILLGARLGNLTSSTAIRHAGESPAGGPRRSVHHVPI